jgi:thioredoxin-related protein
MIRSFLLLLVALIGVGSASAVIQPGDDASKLIPELGEPVGKIEVGEKTVYSYPQGVIQVKEGKVVHISDGFYGSVNQFTRKTATGESIALDRTDENLTPDPALVEPDVEESVRWLTDYVEASLISQDSGKPLLMLFTGSDWSVSSQKLEQEILSSSQFQDFASRNLILLKIDFPRSQTLSAGQTENNENLKHTWNAKGYPTVVLLNPEGLELGRTGYLEVSPEDYVIQLQSIIDSGVDESSSVMKQIRDVMGDDVADALDKFNFADDIGSSAIMLSIQLLLGSIMTFYVIRRLLRR